jgi:hypothetical protein
MPHITSEEAQAWAEQTKLSLPATLNDALEDQIAAEVLSALTSQYDVSTWVDESSTPKLVKTIMAMKYVAWVYLRQYSEDENIQGNYGNLLRADADRMIAGINNGSLAIVEVPADQVDAGQPLFYPTDASSAMSVTDGSFDGGRPIDQVAGGTQEDTSVGPAKFSIGTLW